MIIYYSGNGAKSNPEIVLGDDANLMLTFHKLQDKLDKRFEAILRERRKRKDTAEGESK
jgi:hypothetical protein